MAYFKVFLVQSQGMPRNHHGIFVETRPEGDGVLFHVTGNIQTGMEYERREEPKPEDSAIFVAKEELGCINTSDLDRMGTVCRANPPPSKQFNGPRRIDPTKPLRRCQEWTSETIRDLKNEGVLQPSKAGLTNLAGDSDATPAHDAESSSNTRSATSV